MKISEIQSSAFASSLYLLNTAIDSLYSTLLSGIKDLCSIFYDYLGSLSISSDAIDYSILSLSGFDLLVCLIGGYILIKLIGTYEDKVMHVFLEVPRKIVLSLNSQCETYIAELQVQNAKYLIL